ncbi:MAG: RHS repeat-associated core domain-containing protein [Emticicia sp.]|nr:RHS repeat-associated core domain-containing protein [Emticicia sp.]
MVIFGFNDAEGKKLKKIDFHPQGFSKGLVTGSLVRNLETNTWYKLVNYHDYKGQIIQQFSQNNVGGIDRMDYQYRFNGEVLKMRMTHPKTGAKDLVELYEYSYDHLGRKASFTHNSLVVAKYEYDGIGRLQTKKFRPVGTTQGSSQTGNWTDASSWLSGVFPLPNDNVTINTGHTLTIPAGQIASAGTLNDKGTLRNFGTLNMGKIPTADLYTLAFKHHIRGGLKGYNLDVNNDLTNTLFSFKLAYEDGTGGYYDGNIRNQYWKSNIDGVQRAYEYSYDGASRITGAAYSGKTGESYALNAVSYDFNGNIKTLSRNGWRSNNTFGLVDNLNYTYNISSNKILKVDDASGETASFTDMAGNDYAYNLDGSLASDANKGVTIEYNYLKLPRRIIKGSTVILNEYDANGKKLKETVGSNITDYSSNKIYKNGALYQIGHDEGRIIDGQYEYFINDHLGNLRVAFRDSSGIAKISQKQDYDPYGSELQKLSYLKSSWKQSDFKFSKKEFIEQTSLNDFGWRPQDPILGRMWGSDRFAEKYYDLSNFQYAGNNPIMNIDVNGDSLMLFKNGTYVSTIDNGKKEITGFDQQSTIEKDGKESFTGGKSFNFNDIDLDKDKLKSEKLILNFMSSKDVENVVAGSGAESQGVFSRWVYTSTESNAGNERGTGKMDMRGEVPQRALNIINGVGYNNADTGNYFWGYTMRRMGYSDPAMSVGSNLNAWWSAKQSNGQSSTNPNAIMKWFENRSWGGDSDADQRAIKRGAMDAGSYWSNKLKSLRR